MTLDGLYSYVLVSKGEACLLKWMTLIFSSGSIFSPKLKGLKITGKKTAWKNPEGYLPGKMAPLMKFYVYMSFAYVLLSALWFFQYLRFRKDILQLQHCITVVIVLGLLEMVFWYLDYANFNSTGMRPLALTTWVVTVGAFRKTVSITDSHTQCFDGIWGIQVHSWWSHF